MKAQRKQRLILIGFLFFGAAAVVGFLLLALEENVDLFYPPDQIVAGEAPVDKRIRAGGMVVDGSVERGDSLDVSFVLSDLAGADFEVRYSGILPDLFREGQGIVATGKLNTEGVFVAEQVLAKHDENYMPPELAGMVEEGAAGSDASSPSISGPSISGPGMNSSPESNGLPPALPAKGQWGEET